MIHFELLEIAPDDSNRLQLTVTKLMRTGSIAKKTMHRQMFLNMLTHELLPLVAALLVIPIGEETVASFSDIEFASLQIVFGTVV